VVSVDFGLQRSACGWPIFGGVPSQGDAEFERGQRNATHQPGLSAGRNGLFDQRDPAAPLTSTLPPTIGALDFHKTGTERGAGITNSALRRRKPIKRCGVVQFPTVGRISQRR